jgi:hypothetical protein
MAPEQATAGDVGPWTDLYSVGITAYEMTVDRVPFHDSTTPVAVLMRQVSEEIPSAVSVDPSVDRRFSDWIDRLLVKDSAKRTQSAREAWYELEEIAVAALGPLWRREARLLVSGTDRAAGPLTPAPFDRQTPPPQEAGSGYETYLGESPAAAPPPPPPPPPPERPATVPGQPIPPAAAAAAGQATAAPAAAAPASSSETVQWPAQSRGGRRLIIPVCLVAIAAIAAGTYFVTKGGGSSSSAGKTTTAKTGGSGTTATKLPTVTAVPAQFEPGNLQSVSGFDGHAWAMHKPKEIVDLQSSGTTVPVQMGKGGSSLASGDSALWVSSTNGTAGEIRRVAPGQSPAVGPPIAYGSPPASPRAVVSGGTIWQPTRKGLVKIPEGGGSPQQVQGIAFEPYSVELVAGSIWATDKGGEHLAQVPLSTAKPVATVVTLPSPSPGKDVGWIAGDDTGVYVTTATGVTKIDPKHPSSQTPVPGLPAPPARIDVDNGILWTTSYSPPSGTTVTGTLEGFDLAHPGKHTNAVTFTAPAGTYLTKLVPIAGAFWLTVMGPGGKSGLQPFRFTG